jgi:hypothetical protein
MNRCLTRAQQIERGWLVIELLRRGERLGEIASQVDQSPRTLQRWVRLARAEKGQVGSRRPRGRVIVKWPWGFFTPHCRCDCDMNPPLSDERVYCPVCDRSSWDWWLPAVDAEKEAKRKVAEHWRFQPHVRKKYRVLLRA